MASGSSAPKKGILHRRNRHQGHYDFKLLEKVSPDLSHFVVLNHDKKETIDFANPAAVKALNRALLKQYYGLTYWDIPENYLCPPIPGRADYVHAVADLLMNSSQETVLKPIRVLDVGVGANCVYPMIGTQEYGWDFVGSDIDPVALSSAQKIIDQNQKLKGKVELRLQASKQKIFTGIIKQDEYFNLTMSNPPFHQSAEEAAEVSQRKWKNLGKAAVANFGGKNNELWCEGGEVAFVKKMVLESVAFASQVLWFSSFISKEASLPEIYATLKKVNATDFRTIEMAQGQKKSRFVAWTFS